ncbi:MAG: hemolysin family protein [Gemmatimonadota bacterium]|nr:hemolysin family protein [Gemmatimonadota bacterium]
MSSLIPTLIIAALILLNALFVAAEFAIVGAPRASVERRAGEGDRVAKTVLSILRDPVRQDRYIATAQLGITVASLGLGMYGEHVLAEWIAQEIGGLGGLPPWVAAHTVASIVSITILTYFHIVVGEMVPKSLALQQAERTAMWVTPPILWIQIALYPIILLLNAIANGVLRLFGVNRSEASLEHFRTPEELQFIVRESQVGGLLRKESADVVQELLEWGDLTAGEVMVPRVRIIGIPVGASFQEVRTIIREHPHTRYPIFRENLDHIVGMVHIKDIFRRLRNTRSVHVNDAREVPFVPETAEIETVLTAMRKLRTQLAVVMDEHGGTAGILTIEDLFEEVVGEIEEGAGLPHLYRDADDVLHAAGTVRIEEVGAGLGVVLEHEEVDTVSGLVLSILERPPQIGDSVVFDEVRFEVIAVEGHGVRECTATPLAPPLPGRE